jgi:hypothetical protein
MQKQRTGMGSVIVINDSFGANRKRSSNMQKKAFPLFFRHVYRKPVLDAALWDAASSDMGGLAAMTPHGDEASSVKIVFEHSSGQNNGAFAATTAIGNELQPLQMSAHFDNAFISGEELFREHTSLQQALLQRGHPAGSGRAPLVEMNSTGTRVRSDIVNKLTAKTADASSSSVDDAFNIEKISTHQTDDEDFIPLTEEGTQETEDARNVYKRQMHGEKGSKKPKPTSHKAGKKR